MLGSLDEIGATARPAVVKGRVGRLGEALFKCAVCTRTHWVSAALVYGLKNMVSVEAGERVEGPSLVCPSCGGQAFRIGDPRLLGRRPPATGALTSAPSGSRIRTVPARLRHVCDAVVATPESRVAVLNVGTGEILYLSRRSRRHFTAADEPGPYGRELDAWMALQSSEFERLPELDSEERRSLMRRFVGTLGNDRIRDRLWRLTERRMPYAGFRRGLSHHPWHEGRWLEYSRRYIRPLIMDWLEQEGLVLEATGS